MTMTNEERQIAARERSLALLGWANATLATPRPVAEMWRGPEVPPVVMGDRRTKAPPAGDAPPAGVEPKASPWRSWADAFEKAIGRLTALERQTTSLRFAEVERRCAELERKLAKLEGEANASR